MDPLSHTSPGEELFLSRQESTLIWIVVPFSFFAFSVYSGSVLIVKKLNYDGLVSFAVGIKFFHLVSFFNSHGFGVQIEVDGDNGAHLSFCGGPGFLLGILRCRWRPGCCSRGSQLFCLNAVTDHSKVFFKLLVVTCQLETFFNTSTSCWVNWRLVLSLCGLLFAVSKCLLFEFSRARTSLVNILVCFCIRSSK